MLPNIINKEYIENTKENQYFDRKSARIKPEDLAKHFVGFSNANGGVLVVGVEDDGEITGFDYKGAKDINEFIQVPYSNCLGSVKFEYDISILIEKDKEYKVLIFYIEPSENKVIKTTNGKVYLRVGDKTLELKHEQVSQLEYDKGERSFEDQIVMESTMEDIDQNLLTQYCDILQTELSGQEVLEARGLYKKGHLTNAGILLFAKYPTKFLPNARLRLLKYDGIKMETGSKLNIIKEINFEVPIPRMIQEIRQAINLQLREFQFLDNNGVFKLIPEYPEFAWFEGIVNSLTHRNYALRGDYIRVSLYDDRLEIFSPGKLPNIVTVENMLNTRYSRNPRIARVLSEFGWVKELNEGVKRIYDEMQQCFLNKPIYTEPNNNSVLLTLENSSTSRLLRSSDKIKIMLADSEILGLNEYELNIVRYLMVNGSITMKKTSSLLNRSDTVCRKQLKRLVEKGMIEWHGSHKSDPNQYYTLIK